MQRSCLSLVLALGVLAACSEAATERLLAPFDAAFAAVPCAGDYTLTSQTAVDAFACSDVSGSLTIASADPADPIANLAGLAGLVTVHDDLIIRFNDALPDLDGLSTLDTIGGRLAITGNHGLGDIDGLSGVTVINGAIVIDDNAVLASVDGLSGLTTIQHSLHLQFLPSLPNVAGLSGVTAVYGPLTIVKTGVSNLDGLSLLTFVYGDLDVSANAQLANVDGLAKLDTIGGNFIVESNDNLAHVDGFAALRVVGGDFTLQNNRVLSECACAFYPLFTVGRIGGAVTIRNNAPGCNGPADISALACVPCASADLGSTITGLQGTGALRASHARALTNKLNSAQMQASRGNFVDAAAKIDALITQVTSLEASGEISAGTAAALRAAATVLRDAYAAQIP